MPDTDLHRVPRGALGRAGRALWREITASVELGDATDRQILVQACSLADQADALATALAERPGNVPLAAELRKTRQQIVSLIGQLAPGDGSGGGATAAARSLALRRKSTGRVI